MAPQKDLRPPKKLFLGKVTVFCVVNVNWMLGEIIFAVKAHQGQLLVFTDCCIDFLCPFYQLIKIIFNVNEIEVSTNLQCFPKLSINILRVFASLNSCY